MKFDNEGWGLGTFFGFVIVLLVAAAIAGYNAYKLGLTEDSKPYFDKEIIPTASETPAPTPTPTVDPVVLQPTPSSIPSNINNNEPTSNESTPNVPEYVSENIVEIRHEVIQGAGIYTKSFHAPVKEGESFTVSLKKLVDLNLLPIPGRCTGYVKVKKDKKNLEYVPYLNCPNYLSNGYKAELDER